MGRSGMISDLPSIEAGAPSDPYLMTGYDRKSVRLSHQSSQSVTFTLQIDITGTGLWVNYRTFKAPPGEVVSHDSPAGFSARWIRAVSDQDVIATVLLA